MKPKYIVLEWEQLDYGTRNSNAHTFFTEEDLITFLEGKKYLSDLDVYEVKELQALKVEKSNIILRNKDE